MGHNPSPINQLQEPTKDGQTDENARDNCVAASGAWILEDLTGGTYDGDQLKDVVYGQGYVGFMAPAHFVEYFAAQGVQLVPYSGAQDALVAKLHQLVGSGAGDALVTIPSQWGIAPADPVYYTGPSHVVACAYTLAGGLRMMNPWGGFWHDGNDAYWAARLVYGTIWLATPAPAGVNSVWHRNPDNSATDDKQHRAGPGLAAEIFARNMESSDGLMSETPYTGDGKSFLPLSNGAVLHWNGTGADLDGASVLVDVWEQLQAAKNAPAPADPIATAAKAWLVQGKALLAEV